MSANGSSDKKIDEDKNEANNDDILSSESPTLATRYAHRAAKISTFNTKKFLPDNWDSSCFVYFIYIRYARSSCEIFLFRLTL